MQMGLMQVRDKQLLNNMFIKCGRSELLVIRNFGAIMCADISVLC